MIRFDGHNLAAPVFPMVQPGTLDLILCRNVIIYFDQPTILALMKRFANALSSEGVLLLGYSESLFRMTTGLEMVEVANTFVYRRTRPKPIEAAVAPRPSRPVPPAVTTPTALAAVPKPSAPRPPLAAGPSLTPAPLTVLPPAAGFTPGGTPAVPSASAPRPSAAARGSAPQPSAPRPLPVPEAHRSPAERLEEVTALVAHGDFPRALLAARRLADDVPEDLAGQLTLGNIHVLMGNLENAREVFQRALQKEPLCAEARLYLAVASLQAGQLDEARTELSRTLFLEPTLALGHYLLAQVLERKGDAEAARRAYRNAIAQRRVATHVLVGHFPDLPKSNEAIAQAAQYRLAALSEA